MRHSALALWARRGRLTGSAVVGASLLAVVVLGGCGLFSSGGEDEGAPNVVETDGARALVPTFTATPPGQAQAAAPASAVTPVVVVTPAVANAPVVSVAPVVTAAVSASVPATGVAAISGTAPVSLTAQATITPTAAAKARLTVQQDLVNVRTGPGTEYGLGGTANKGDQFDIVSKDATGQWWQVCCVSGEPVWVFGELATVENGESVAVGENLAPAVAVQPVPVAPAPAAPAQPAPTDTPAPPPAAAPPADDPCAGIGGDGCKFRLKGGPTFAPNGGSEIKLTLGFIHSGIDGGQPQGSYFVVLLKDGAKINVSDSVRSFDPSVGMRDGPNGKYNYEYKVGLDSIPGGTVAGNYTIWVLDGNGERDSQSINFSVPDGQGEIWMLFDQG